MIENIRNYKSIINFILYELEKYFLPIAVFFLLISTAILNIFILLVVVFTIFHIFHEKDFSNLIPKKFILYGLLIFLFLLMSLYFSTGDEESIISSLKKYVKFLYIPFLYIYIKRNNNTDLIIKYFISGGILVLCISYLKYFELLNLVPLYEFYNMNLVGTITKASVFQNSIVHGAVFSFIAYLSIFVD